MYRDREADPLAAILTGTAVALYSEQSCRYPALAAIGRGTADPERRVRSRKSGAPMFTSTAYRAVEGFSVWPGHFPSMFFKGAGAVNTGKHQWLSPPRMSRAAHALPGEGTRVSNGFWANFIHVRDHGMPFAPVRAVAKTLLSATGNQSFFAAMLARHGDSCISAHRNIIPRFAGSGTVSRVASRLGRRSIGIELSEEYVEKIARKRNNQGSLGL